MGTSVSQSSPSTPIWQAAQTTYYSLEIPIERTVKELWRAADSEADENLARDLQAPIIAECLRITLASSTRTEAVRNVARMVASSDESSLAAEIARRAAARSFSGAGSSVGAFAKAVFADAGDYLASRDLPGFVGINEKLLKVSDLMSLKKDIRDHIAEMVEDVELPEEANIVEGWSEYAGRVVNTLKGLAA
ncbi:MAG: hypothetical protein WKF28_00360 [Rubrobacteraceae bacterium]